MKSYRVRADVDAMNVLFLSEVYPPHGSGAELATQYYAELLSQNQINVTILTNRFDGELSFEKRQNLTIHRLAMFGDSGSIKYSILKRPDVLFSNTFSKLLNWADIVYVPRFWFSAILFAKARGKRVIAHLHDYIPICSLSSIHNEKRNEFCKGSKFSCPGCIYCFENVRGRSIKEILSSIFLNSSIGQYFPKIIQFADAVICVSEAQKKLIVEKLPSLHDKIRVIYNPFPKFSEDTELGNDFGYFGGTDPLKGFSVLLDSMIYLNSRSDQIKIHATKIQSANNDFNKKLNKIGFLTHGKLQKKEFESIYAQVKGVLIPSIWPEPWPYVVVEALVRGRMVVGSEIGGIPEQVKGCKGAYLTKAGSFRALASSIEFVNNLSQAEIFELGKQNRDTFLRKFNNDSSVSDFIHVCENLKNSQSNVILKN